MNITDLLAVHHKKDRTYSDIRPYLVGVPLDWLDLDLISDHIPNTHESSFADYSLFLEEMLKDLVVFKSKTWCCTDTPVGSFYIEYKGQLCYSTASSSRKGGQAFYIENTEVFAQMIRDLLKYLCINELYEMEKEPQPVDSLFWINNYLSSSNTANLFIDDYGYLRKIVKCMGDFGYVIYLKDGEEHRYEGRGYERLLASCIPQEHLNQFAGQHISIFKEIRCQYGSIPTWYEE